jgi:hypothetical protein
VVPLLAKYGNSRVKVLAGLEIHDSRASKAFAVVPTSILPTIALVPCLFPCAQRQIFLQYFELKSALFAFFSKSALSKNWTSSFTTQPT